jgi:hypothetical protein
MSDERMGQRGWIGVDLDGTLAHYDRWRGVEHIGEPIPAMVARVKAWLADGQEVRIFTARVSRAGYEGIQARGVIGAWLCKQGLPRLEITCTKDFAMIELWDDRCVQVEPNIGIPHCPDCRVEKAL